MNLKAYCDLNFFEKIIFRICLFFKLKKYKINKKELLESIKYTKILEEFPREDKSFNETIKEFFNA